MTQVWDDANKLVPVTVVKAAWVVTEVRTVGEDGYSAVELAFGAIDPRKVTKPQAGHFTKAVASPGATPPRRGPHFGGGDYTLGQELWSWSQAGQVVDVTGRSKGKGHRGRHEAPRLPRRRRLARCAP